MAEAEYRQAERHLQRVQDMFSDRQGRRLDRFQSTLLFTAEQEFVRARNIRNFVRRVEGNNPNSAANDDPSMISHLSKKPVGSPTPKPSITSPPSTPQKKKPIAGDRDPGSPLPPSTPQRKAQATVNKPSTPSKKSPGPLTPSTLQSPYPNRRHYTVVRGRRVGVYSSW